jgi:signal transduction histidine kinase
MERFGGNLQAENHPQGGAVFRMVLPVAAAGNDPCARMSPIPDV